MKREKNSAENESQELGIDNWVQSKKESRTRSLQIKAAKKEAASQRRRCCRMRLGERERQDIQDEENNYDGWCCCWQLDNFRNDDRGMTLQSSVHPSVPFSAVYPVRGHGGAAAYVI